ncbi:MAG: polysaccharide deacetylase family protein [Anaerolineales bacterium]
MNKRGQRLALRLDDVGASTKKYEVYSQSEWRAGPLRVSANWLFLKYLSPFRAWGPYREMSASEWEQVLDLLARYKAKLTVAVTAVWVEEEDYLIPFPQRFPAQAKVLKAGREGGLLEIANHGLTHCVLANNAFKPRLFAGNRESHREFGPQINAEIQDEHLRRSQEILQEWLGAEVITFVPPGNLFTEETLDLAARHGLRFVSCDAPAKPGGVPRVLGNEHTIAFHDRDIVLHGIKWLEEQLEAHRGEDFSFVRELGTEMVKVNGR